MTSSENTRVCACVGGIAALLWVFWLRWRLEFKGSEKHQSCSKRKEFGACVKICASKAGSVTFTQKQGSNFILLLCRLEVGIMLVPAAGDCHFVRCFCPLLHVINMYKFFSFCYFFLRFCCSAVSLSACYDFTVPDHEPHCGVSMATTDPLSSLSLPDGIGPPAVTCRKFSTHIRTHTCTPTLTNTQIYMFLFLQNKSTKMNSCKAIIRLHPFNTWHTHSIYSTVYTYAHTHNPLDQI